MHKFQTTFFTNIIVHVHIIKLKGSSFLVFCSFSLNLHGKKYIVETRDKVVTSTKLTLVRRLKFKCKINAGRH